MVIDIFSKTFITSKAIVMRLVMENVGFVHTNNGLDVILFDFRCSQVEIVVPA